MNTDSFISVLIVVGCLLRENSQCHMLKCVIAIGELSLEFPESNKQERGGILADGKLDLLMLLVQSTQIPLTIIQKWALEKPLKCSV